MKRVMIFHISEVGGHSKAAENIKEALLYREPAVEVVTINGLGYFYPVSEKIINFLYSGVIKYFPSLWGRIYDRKKIVHNLNPIRHFINQRTFQAFSRLLAKFNPDCFVATQAFPCGLIADYKKQFRTTIPLMAVITDYYPHRFWVHPFVDWYIVACQKAKEILMEEGIDEARIKIFGIPISYHFLNSHPREHIAGEYGFVRNLPAVLLMGGGLGLGPIEKIATYLDSLPFDFQIIVVCGRNKKIYKWFTKAKFTKPLFYFRYVDFVNKLMDFSDIIVTKAGGITISEALAKGLAIVVTKPIPGQEERNEMYLIDNQSIMSADYPEAVGRTVEILLRDSQMRQVLRARAKKISFIDSSLRIADLILKI